MKYVAAYLLATLGGKDSPSAADVSAILKAAGADVDQGQLDNLMKAMAGKTVSEVLEAGRKKIGSMAPAAGAAPAAGCGGGGGGAPAAKAPEPEEEEADDDMGFSLFD